ncbi:polysaccharide deacetylase family protein [Legionella spiritensis]|uniref:Uncharacterized protein n=1 Tax=Legionella spiritensis TaxID=452 RepID=A0A0W0YYL1_LEGSP|nr:hypothetical protein [Legionella spiritensis]KTD62005.1 hypothetical protein Lspi_1855 [Legionella spiritensis]SNV34829.1 Uncharacterised protein [Legionella spiritensis]
MYEYNPSEFTFKSYKRLIDIAKRRFEFADYSSIYGKDRFLLLRHDIDFSLEHAVNIARIEKDMSVRSTFFIHLHNEFYNALDSYSLQIMKEILSLNHSIGLHFDIHYYDIKKLEQLTYWLDFEKSILESILNIKIQVFSFHNTNEFTMSFEDDSYAGMTNTYSHYFKNEVDYCSDSNGYWRYRKLEEVLLDENINKLQVLLHPGWWTEHEMLPREKVVDYASKRMNSSISNYDQALIHYGRLNLG